MILPIQKAFMARQFFGSKWDDVEGIQTPRGSKVPISICGWLYKMKRAPKMFHTRWVRRWFVVQDGTLSWFTTPNAEKCNGFICLSNVNSVRKFGSELQRNIVFSLMSSDRNMILRADSPSDVSRWIRGINLQLDLLHGGTINGPPPFKYMIDHLASGNDEVDVNGNMSFNTKKICAALCLTQPVTYVSEKKDERHSSEIYSNLSKLSSSIHTEYYEIDPEPSQHIFGRKSSLHSSGTSSIPKSVVPEQQVISPTSEDIECFMVTSSSSEITEVSSESVFQYSSQSDSNVTRSSDNERKQSSSTSSKKKFFFKRNPKFPGKPSVGDQKKLHPPQEISWLRSKSKSIDHVDKPDVTLVEAFYGDGEKNKSKHFGEKKIKNLRTGIIRRSSSKYVELQAESLSRDTVHIVDSSKNAFV